MKNVVVTGPRSGCLSIPITQLSPHPRSGSLCTAATEATPGSDSTLATISWNLENTGTILSSVWSTVLDNLFELHHFSGLKLLDIRFPDVFADAYPGPAFAVGARVAYTVNWWILRTNQVPIALPSILTSARTRTQSTISYLPTHSAVPPPQSF
jgi:hypothetical protein